MLAAAFASTVGFHAATTRTLAPAARLRGAGAVMMPLTVQDEVKQLRAELVRKDAIIKGLLDTLEVTSITTDDTPVSSTPLQDLCQISKEACDAVTPMLKAFYDKISDQRHGGSSKLKSDATYFTIADGIVQHMFITHLFAGNKFAQIVGEEDESVINIIEKPYSVDDLMVPDEFNSIIESTLKEIDLLSARISPTAYKTVTAFVDPIDGTREFATKKGEQCTICIGFARGDTGEAHAGLVYRPLTAPPTFALGCAAEGVARSSLDHNLGGATTAPPRTHTPPGAASARGLMCSNGSLSPFTQALAIELGSGLVRAGGAGNKVLLLLEGKGQSYIQDRGVSRWDTCAAQAVLEAHGGCLAKLAAFATVEAESSLVTYRYVPSETNADFEPGLASLTAYNAKEPPKAAADGGAPPRATAVEQLKPYANTCGLFALAPSEMSGLAEYRRAIVAATAQHPPAYD